jgi:hypothetical protein
MGHSHRCISAWVRLRSSEEALARVVTLYKVGIPVNFEQHLRRPWRGFRGAGGGWRWGFVFCLHPNVGLHVGTVPYGLLKSLLKVFTVID